MARRASIVKSCQRYVIMAKPTRLQVLALAIGYLVLPVVVLGLLYLVDRPVDIPDEYLVKDVEYLISYAEAPPAETADWQRLDQILFDLPNDPYTSAWLRTALSQLRDERGSITIRELQIHQQDIRLGRPQEIAGGLERRR